MRWFIVLKAVAFFVGQADLYVLVSIIFMSLCDNQGMKAFVYFCTLTI